MSAHGVSRRWCRRCVRPGDPVGRTAPRLRRHQAGRLPQGHGWARGPGPGAQLRLDPFSGVAIVFRAKRADRVKILLWDGSGMVLVGKRLDEGRFAWPAVKDGVMTLSTAQLAALFEGLDWRRVHARRTRRPSLAG